MNTQTKNTAQDMQNLPSDTIRSVLRETIEKTLDSKLYKFHIDLAVKLGENNFIGIIYRVSFNEIDENKNSKGPIEYLILKVAPQDLKYRNEWFVRPCFLREVYMYNKVLPTLRQFEVSKGILEENTFSAYPKCFNAIDLIQNECILLEDLCVREFHTTNLHIAEMSADHVRLVMQALGKFHAISFALNDQQPEKFAKLNSTLTPVFCRKDAGQRELLKNQSVYLMKIVSSAEDSRLLAQLKKLFEKGAADVATECRDPKLTGAATVILHGDAWQNNFMFRNDDRGKPIEVMLLDWQLSQCASPVIDLSFFIFCSTTKKLRDDHYEEFLKVYHDSLSKHIRTLGSDPEKLYPYELMLKHFHNFGRLALILVSIILPLIITDDTREATVDGQVETDTNDQPSKVDSRLRDIIIDMVRLGYI